MQRAPPIQLPQSTRLSVECRGTAQLCDIAGPASGRRQSRSILNGTPYVSRRLSVVKDASCPQVSGRPAAPLEEGSTDQKVSLGRFRDTLDKPRLWPDAFPPWQWASSLTWRSACLFFMGSILFTLSCSTGLFQIMASHSLRKRMCVAYPYAAGSVLYTWGAYCTMVASADAAPENHSKLLMGPLNRALHRCFRLHFKLHSAQEWAILDLTGAVIVWVGTLLYNSSCIAPAILATLTVPLPAASLAAVLQWAVKVPNIIAGCFFVTGSYLAWAAAARSLSLLHVFQDRLPAGSFWAFLLYFLGSVGFLTGALLSEPVFVLPASILIDEWFGMFVGYFLGSLCFLSGSYLGMSTVDCIVA